jgi:hypothetical protein
MDRLARIPRMMPTATTTHQGRVVLREEALRSSSGGVNVLNANPFRAEDFDGRASIASIDSKWFSIVRQSASRPIENEGRAGTTALMLDAGDRGESVLRFEISLGAERVEQIAGRIGVSLWSRGVAGEAGWSPGFLTVIGREESPDRSRAARVELPEIQAGSGWTQLRAVTPRMNFRLQRAFLTLRVEGAARRALVDDLRVDLLPYDTDEQLLEAVARRTPKTERRFEPTDHYLFQVYDKDGDGKIARSEVPEEAFRLFDRVDANADGVVTHEEALADLMRRFGRGDGIPPIAAR